MSRNSLLCALCLLASVVAIPAAADHEGVTLYRDDHFRGRSESFIGDVPSLSGTRIGNDAVSSFDLAPGCQVTLYADSEYRGRSETFTRSVDDLGRTRFGNDAVSSLRVDCRGGGPGYGDDGYGDDGYGDDGYGDDGYGGGPGGGLGGGPGGSPGVARSGVTLYTGPDYRGDFETFYRDDPGLYNNQVKQGRARSVQVSPGCEVTLYEYPDYGGRSVRLTGDYRDLSRTNLGGAGVSSLRVTCRIASDPPGGGFVRPEPPDRERRGVTLYHDDGFRGGSEKFYEDRSDLGRSYIGNDNASSIRVDPGCRAVLYRDSNFRGAYAVIENDVSSLRATEVGNDGASSLKVECQRRRNRR